MSVPFRNALNVVCRCAVIAIWEILFPNNIRNIYDEVNAGNTKLFTITIMVSDNHKVKMTSVFVHKSLARL